MHSDRVRSRLRFDLEINDMSTDFFKDSVACGIHDVLIKLADQMSMTKLAEPVDTQTIVLGVLKDDKGNQVGSWKFREVLNDG